MAADDNDDELFAPPARRPPPLAPTPQELARLCADLRLVKSALSEQSVSLSTLTSQVTRLTHRQDNQDAAHLEAEMSSEKALAELDTVTTALGAVVQRLDAMQTTVDKVFLALAQFSDFDAATD